MKNIFTVLLVMFVCFSFKAYTQIAQKGEDGFTKYEQTHDDGSIKTRYYFDSEFRRVGKWSIFHLNGNIYKEFTYHRDKLDGDYKIYFGNGKLNALMQFTDGKLNGSFIVMEDNNDTLVNGNFKNGEKNGEWVYYCPKEGCLTGQYLNDMFVGKWTFYFDNMKDWESYFKNGQSDSIFITYHKNGQIREKGTQNDKYKTGIQYTYDENGELVKEEDYTEKKLSSYITYINAHLKSIIRRVHLYEARKILDPEY